MVLPDFLSPFDDRYSSRCDPVSSIFFPSFLLQNRRWVACRLKAPANGHQNKSTIEGLWIVKLVKVGEEEMTPNARWTRFNSDLTQESGNGRFQHSYGTWKLNTKSKELTIKNLNGLKDLNAPFKITVN